MSLHHPSAILQEASSVHSEHESNGSVSNRSLLNESNIVNFEKIEGTLDGEPDSIQHTQDTPINYAQQPNETSTWQRLLGFILASISTIVYAVMSLLVNIIGHRFPTLQIAAFRFIIQAIFALSCVWYQHVPLRGKTGKFRLILLRGVLGACGMCSTFWAFSHLPLADATVLIATNPVFTILLGYLLLGEAFTLLDAFLTFMCFGGVLFISRPALIFGDKTDLEIAADQYGGDSENGNLEFAGLSFTATRTFGVIIGLVASIVAALAYITVRRIGKEESPFLLVAWYAIVGVLLSFSLGLAGQEWQWPTERTDWLILVVIGLLGFSGQMLLNRALQLEKAGPVSMIRNLDLVFAFLLQIIFLEQPLNAWSIVGAACILVCALIAAIKKARTHSTHQPLVNVGEDGDVEEELGIISFDENENFDINVDQLHDALTSVSDDEQFNVPVHELTTEADSNFRDTHSVVSDSSKPVERRYTADSSGDESPWDDDQDWME